MNNSKNFIKGMSLGMAIGAGLVVLASIAYNQEIVDDQLDDQIEQNSSMRQKSNSRKIIQMEYVST